MSNSQSPVISVGCGEGRLRAALGAVVAESALAVPGQSASPWLLACGSPRPASPGIPRVILRMTVRALAAA
jgi:hypothetical protein